MLIPEDEDDHVPSKSRVQRGIKESQSKSRIYQLIQSIVLQKNTHLQSSTTISQNTMHTNNMWNGAEFLPHCPAHHFVVKLQKFQQLVCCAFLLAPLLMDAHLNCAGKMFFDGSVQF